MKRGNWTDKPCWYASVEDGGKRALLLGPFTTEKECREFSYKFAEDGGNLSKCNQLRKCCEVDSKSWFYSYGMVKLANGYQIGMFNEKFRTDGLWIGTLN